MQRLFRDRLKLIRAIAAEAVDSLVRTILPLSIQCI